MGMVARMAMEWKAMARKALEKMPMGKATACGDLARILGTHGQALTSGALGWVWDTARMAKTAKMAKGLAKMAKDAVAVVVVVGAEVRHTAAETSLLETCGAQLAVH